MLARIRKTMEEKDQGFTLIELLVVMIIIGILAAIAIPVFLNQREKARDTAARSDVSTLGKEIATYYVDATTVLAAADVVLTAPGGEYTVDGNDAGQASDNISAVALSYGDPTTVASASGSWCVELTYTDGSRTEVSYSAENGLQNTPCP